MSNPQTQGPSHYRIPAQVMQALIAIMMEQPAGKVINVANATMQTVQEQEAAFNARGGDVPELPTIDAMVDRFLAWPLPHTVMTDGATHKAPTDRLEGWSATGTNLLSGVEARAMLRHVLGIMG